MRLLLDTHTFLWFVNGDALLSPKARQLIEDTNNQRWLRMASVWEIAIKISIGKMRLSQSLESFAIQETQNNLIDLLEIKTSHIAQVVTLPFHHRDPFDRMLLAQATVENLTLVSVDSMFDQYQIKRVW